MSKATDLTSLLLRVEGTDNRDVVDQLLPHVYSSLHEMADRQLRGERQDHTLNATALVHEAYLKLVRQEQVGWKNRAHFFGIASIAMRRILVNYARSRAAQKRGGEDIVTTFVEGDVVREAKADELIALDEALDRLHDFSERQARVVEMWFFGGLTQEEIAEVLETSVATVRRDWTFARAWLSRELQTDPGDPPTHT